MRIYFISPQEFKTPMLFDTFISTFESKGHIIVDNIKEADCIFFDLHSRIGGYNESSLKAILDKKIPTFFFDAYDFGAMAKYSWPGVHLQQVTGLFSKMSALGIYKVFFIRKMDKTEKYLERCYPYELIQYEDHVFEPTTKEELFNRPIDICFIGNKSDSRISVCNGLKDHFKCDFVIAQPRLEHDVWLNRHRQSKLFLVADGAGFNDERVYQLIYISALLKQRNNQLVINDFEDGIDCIKIHEYPNDFDIEDIRYVLSEPQILYDIYLNGIEKMKTYFNAEYRANYILKTLSDNGIN